MQIEVIILELEEQANQPASVDWAPTTQRRLELSDFWPSKLDHTNVHQRTSDLGPSLNAM